MNIRYAAVGSLPCVVVSPVCVYGLLQHVEPVFTIT